MSNKEDSFKNNDDKFCIVEQKFLELNKEEKVNIFLVNGVKIQCNIIEWDDVCIIVTQKENRGKQQLIYKENIATIQECNS